MPSKVLTNWMTIQTFLGYDVSPVQSATPVFQKLSPATTTALEVSPTISGASMEEASPITTANLAGLNKHATTADHPSHKRDFAAISKSEGTEARPQSFRRSRSHSRSLSLESIEEDAIQEQTEATKPLPRKKHARHSPRRSVSRSPSLPSIEEEPSAEELAERLLPMFQRAREVLTVRYLKEFQGATRVGMGLIRGRVDEDIRLTAEQFWAAGEMDVTDDEIIACIEKALLDAANEEALPELDG